MLLFISEAIVEYRLSFPSSNDNTISNKEYGIAITYYFYYILELLLCTYWDKAVTSIYESFKIKLL